MYLSQPSKFNIQITDDEIVVIENISVETQTTKYPDVQSQKLGKLA